MPFQQAPNETPGPGSPMCSPCVRKVGPQAHTQTRLPCGGALGPSGQSCTCGALGSAFTARQPGTSLQDCLVGSALTSPLFPESLHTRASVSWSLRAHPKPQKVQACHVSGLSGREADRHVPIITVGAPPPGQALGVCPVSPETRAFPGKSARCPSAVMQFSSESSQGVTSLGAVGGRPFLPVFPSLHQVCCVSQGSQGNPCPVGLITPSRAQSLWGLTGLLPAPVPPPCSLPHLSFTPQTRPPPPCLPDLATAPAQALHLQVHSPRALHSGARSLLKGHLGN